MNFWVRMFGAGTSLMLAGWVFLKVLFTISYDNQFFLWLITAMNAIGLFLMGIGIIAPNYNEPKRQPTGYVLVRV